VARCFSLSRARPGSQSGWTTRSWITSASGFHQIGGGNFQVLIKEALRVHIRRGGIKAAVRRAIREELREAGVNKRLAAEHLGLPHTP
jgi:hypothetical protein